jgi:hypothetical protein
MSRSLLARVAPLVAAAAAACSASAEHAVAEDELASTPEAMFGDDRVGAALRGHTDRIPTTLAEVEALFGIGRACARADSKEIFVVEESRSRLPNGEVTQEGALLPRAVISGCNTGDLSDPTSIARSTSLFVALISDPDRGARTGGDGILTEPIEVMAFDEKAGIYDFYVFDRTPDGKPEVTRIYRDEASGAVLERRIVANGRASAPAPPADGSKRCFACHVNGAPLMNELRDPWTNWISFKKSLPVSRLAGATKELVSEAAPSASTGRASLANDLEPIMRSAIRAHVSGAGGAGSGWAARTVGRRDGLARLLSSVLCETELNYATSTDAIPIEAFIDPDVTSGDLVPPDAFDDRPVQMPIRSEMDRAVEGWLIDQGYLSHDVALAIRLFDDENDVFSDTRCKLKEGALAAVGRAREPAEVGERLRAFLLARAAEAPFAQTHPKRHAYLTALLQPSPEVEALDAAYAEYATELAARFEEMKADLSRVEARDRARKDRARRMFPGPSTPLPILP